MRALKRLDEINDELSLLWDNTDYELHLSIVFDNGTNGWILIELMCYEEKDITYLKDTWDFGNFGEDYKGAKKEVLPTLNNVYRHILNKFNERGFEGIRQSMTENDYPYL
jgi:hypothetical protein